MELRSPADDLWFNTAYLECCGSKGKSSGTGFFFAVTVHNPDTGKNGHLWWLITNRHVAIAADDRMDIHLIKAAEEAGRFAKPLLGERVGVSLKNASAAFYFHPDPDIDVAALPFNHYMDELVNGGGPPMLTSIAAEQTLTAEAAEELDSLEQVVVIGYPVGLYDSYNLTPIARTGHTATPIRVDYEGRPTFLIDAPIFPGSSGSPVFLMKRPASVSSDIGAPDSPLLLGVVAEAHTFGGAAPVRGKNRPKRAASLIDLGIVYKASTILECVDAILVAEGTERVQSPKFAAIWAQSSAT